MSSGKGEITKKDIETISEHFYEKLQPEYLSQIIKSADVDSDGKITENDFISLIKHTNYI